MPRKQSAQILMTECPLNTRCISRNFCDNNGMVTKTRHNDLLFENDRRGFIACVDSKKNVLGVCCVDLSVMLAGAGRPIRQDEVFTVESSIDEMRTTSGQTFATTPGPFVIINISADNADINGQVTDDPRVQTNTNINNMNTKRPASRPRPSVSPDFLANNPFIGQTNSNDDDNISLSPTDVMAILDIMNENRITNSNNNNNNFGTVSDQVFTTCPAATLCVDRTRCDFNGVITTSSISLNPRLASMQVALNRCTTDPRRRQGRQNADMVCCRDPNKVKNNNNNDYDEFSDDFGDADIEYSSYEIEDMDKIYMYNMKTPYQTKSKQDEDDRSEKLRRRKKKKKSQPLTSLRPPSNKFSGRKKKNRESLDFFTNG